MIPAAIHDNATEEIQKAFSTIVGLKWLPLMYFSPCIEDSCV